MGSGTFYPAVDGDDGYWRTDEAFYGIGSDIDFVQVGNANTIDKHFWCRFPNVTIPPGSTITSCYIKVYNGFMAQSDDCFFKLHFELAADAVAPISFATAQALSLTTGTAWNFSNTWNPDTWHDSVDFSDELQEVIDLGGWDSGQAVMVVCKEDGSDSWQDRLINDIYAGEAYRIELHVEWEEATSGIYYPAVSGDDGYWRGGSFYDYQDYTMFGNNGEYPVDCYFRFTNVTVPEGMVITSAFVRLKARLSKSGNISNNIYANDVDDAVAPTSEAEGDALVKTSAVAPWAITESWTAEQTYDTPSLIDVIQEVIDREGREPGYALQIIMIDDETAYLNNRNFYAVEHDAGDDAPELHLAWSPPPIEASISEGMTSKLDLEVLDFYAEISEGFTVHDESDGLNTSCEISEGFVVGDQVGAVDDAEVVEDVTVDDAADAVKEHHPTGPSEDVTLADSLAVTQETGISEGLTTAETLALSIEVAPLTENITTAAAVVGNRILYLSVTENLMFYDILGWAWGKVVADAIDMAGAVTPAVAIPVNESLVLAETLHNNWTGTEAVESSLQMLGQLIIGEIFNETATSTIDITDATTFLHQMISAIFDTVDFGETLASQAEFNPLIVEAIAITGLVEVLTNLHNTNSETLTLADAAGVGWGKSVIDTIALADAPTILWYAMVVLTDSIDLTETVLNQFQFNDIVTDAIEFAASIALQQVLTSTVEETINFGIVIELDGELWETWVLNTNAFHASVYSGYNFNSYAVHNNTAYGCKTDGIYKLAGSTDDGNAFQPGIVLPESRFGTHHYKRFRVAYFGIAGTSPAIKLVNEDGTSKTYTITKSKVTPTRGVKGRKWTVSIGDFDSLDFVELVPLILTR